MKYDADIDLSGNASHAVVADLVGTGKRVLDVGCATGYLAAALVQRGNVVSGVEIDVEAST
jgi:tRNA A22 N-methylase